MKWRVAGLYTFSAVVMFISIALIYNLDKKKVAQMTEDLKASRAAEVAEDAQSNSLEVGSPAEVAEDVANVINENETDETNEE